MRIPNILSKFDIKSHCISVIIDDIQCVNMPELKCKVPYTIRKFQYTNNDYQQWCYIVNHAYNEEQYDFEHAHDLLTNHYLFDQLETFFLEKESTPLGTISLGQYKDNASIGGVCRIAVLPSERGNNFGKALLMFAIKRLKERGYRTFKSVIASKRKVSAFMHFNVGCKPLIYNNIQWGGGKTIVVSLLFNRRLNKICKQYFKEYKEYHHIK